MSTQSIVAPHHVTKSTVAPRHFTSLRDFLDALSDLGDMREVSREVDTDLEIGAIIRRTLEAYAPAPLFRNPQSPWLPGGRGTSVLQFAARGQDGARGARSRARPAYPPAGHYRDAYPFDQEAPGTADRGEQRGVPAERDDR